MVGCSESLAGENAAEASTRVDELARRARADLAALSHPDRGWVPSLQHDHSVVADALVVGGGQSGVIIAAALQREGVQRVSVLDSAPPGSEGPWTTYARMAELRTPKQLVGSEFGVPNLSLRSWFAATYGDQAWDQIERVPRLDWQRYLDWYVSVTGVTIENDRHVTDVFSSGDGVVGVRVEHDGTTSTRLARTVVLATGFDGAGAWRVPDFVSAALPSDRYDHSNADIDFSKLAGRRVGVLGHGAAAFDNSIAALRAGAASVDLCFRRPRLPRVNPHRFLETAGVMTHYAELDDATRWQIAHYFKTNDQPPPIRSFTEAMEMPGLRLRPATPWLSVALDGDSIAVETPDETLAFDHLILATGAVTDLAARPELRTIAPIIDLWSDRYQPPPELEDDRLSALPYLGSGYEFEPRSSDNDWVQRVFAFNFSSAVSHAPHSTSISGHKHALPRLVRGITRRLVLDVEVDLVNDLTSYVSDDLPVPADFEQHVGDTAEKHSA